MILHDRVDIIHGGGTLENVPAHVEPLSSKDIIEQGGVVESYYRVIIKPTSAASLNSQSRFVWRGKTMVIDGDLEIHSVRGRIKFLAATVRLSGGTPSE